MKTRNPQRTEADEQVLEEAGKYFEVEEIVAMQENALQNRKRKILVPQLKALFEQEADDQ